MLAVVAQRLHRHSLGETASSRELDTPTAVILVLVMVAGIAAYVLNFYAADRRAEAKRAREMAFFARENDFHVLRNLSAFRRTIGDFSLFNRGEAAYSPRLRNVMRQKRDGVTVALCDYLYWTDLGRTVQRHEQTVCVLVSPGSSLPHFFLRRQFKLLDFEERDINFDEDPEFSKAFVLVDLDRQLSRYDDDDNDNEGDLRPWFTGDRRARLTELAVTGFELEARGDTIVFHFGFRTSFDDLARLINYALAVRDALR